MKQVLFFFVLMLSNIGLIFAQTPSMSNDKEKIVNTLNKTFLDLYMDSDTSNLSIIEKESLFLKNVSNDLNDDFKKNIDILPILDIFNDETFLKNIKFDAKSSDLYGLAVSNFIHQESQYIDHIKLKNDEIKNGKSPFQENLQKSSFTDSLQLYFNIQDTEDTNAKLMSYHTIEQNFKSFSNLLEKDKNVLIDQKIMIQYIQLTHSIYALQPKKINHLINQILLEHHDQDLKKEVQNLLNALDEYGDTYDEIVNENVNDAKKDENKLKYFKFKKWLKNGFLEFLIQRMYQNSKVSRLKEQVFQIASQYTENTSPFEIKKNRANQRFLIRCLYAAYYHFMIESELLTDYEIKNAKLNNMHIQVGEDSLEVLKLYNGDQICLNNPTCTLDTLGKSKNIKMEEVNGKIQILCEMGKYEYCGVLGYFHHQGYLVEKNLDLSFKYFKFACEIANQQRSCLFLGVLYGDEKFGKRDLEKSKQILDGICEKKDRKGCTSLGTLKEEEGKKDEAILLYQKSCDLNDGQGCVFLGILKEKEGNKDEAILLFQKSCDLNDGQGCACLGILKAKEGRKDEAILLYQKSCDLNERFGCFFGGVLKAEEGRKDEAILLYQKSCDLNDGQGCLFLGVLKAKEGRKDEAILLYQKSCDLNYGPSCTALGRFKQEKRKKDEAILLFQKSCDLNDVLGCSILGVLKAEEGRKDEAILLFQKSCDLNDGPGCRKLGNIKFQTNQADEGVLLYQKACTLNDLEACEYIERSKRR